jgi:DNA anti-recombination protein RmuC
MCEICDKWSHPKCVGISPEVYAFISDNLQIHWFCQMCNTGVGKILKEVSRLQEKFTTMENMFDKHKDEVIKEMEKMRMKVRKDMQREMEKSREIVKKEVRDVKCNFQQRIDEMKTEVECTKAKIDSLDSTFSTQSVQEPQWAEVVSKHVDVELKSRSTEFQDMQKALSEAKLWQMKNMTRKVEGTT